MPRKVLLFFVLLNVYSKSCGQSVPEYIKSQHYPVETHKVTTQSGFVLGIHRIPDGRKASGSNATKPVVLLQHGFATSSDCWVLSGPKTALGFILADKGYDVWLANSRGTVDSFEHTKFNLSESKGYAKFTRYSFYQRGVEDLPTTIDYILKTTDQSTLALYTHSEGASMFYVMGAKKSDYLKKINSFYAFAPVVFIGNTTSPTAKIVQLLNKFYLLNVVYNLGKPMVNVAKSALRTAASNIITRTFAGEPFKFFGGTAQGQISGNTLTRLYDYFPSFVSLRQLKHLAQLINSNQFREYDFPIWDLHHILQFRPKKFDLSKIKVPSYLYFSDGDQFINVNNLEKFDAAFKSKPKVFLVHNDFGHYDFVYGKDAKNVYELTFGPLGNHTSS